MDLRGIWVSIRPRRRGGAGNLGGVNIKPCGTLCRNPKEKHLNKAGWLLSMGDNRNPCVGDVPTP
jgi:hypothetical protein